MPSFARVAVSCPYCAEIFLESAKLIRSGGSAWCPTCQRLFEIDRGLPDHREALKQARIARSRRRERVAELRREWARPAPVERPPKLRSDLLRTLDDLIARFNDPND